MDSFLLTFHSFVVTLGMSVVLVPVIAAVASTLFLLRGRDDGQQAQPRA